MGTLYLVATPIGNLEDITLRALRVLREVSLIAAEDTRTARKLLTHFDIRNRLLSYNEHNMRSRTPQILEALTTGDVAFISEAGMPAISDPGYELALAAVQAGHRVSPLPGPSAIVAAVAVSGLPAREFTFAGFLPRRAAERRRLLSSLAVEPRTLVLFEAPHRLRDTLADVLSTLGDRRIAVCRELTKTFEEVFRGSVREAFDHFDHPRGEFTLVIEGATPSMPEVSEEAVRQELIRLKGEGLSPRDAVSRAAHASGLPRRDVYRLWTGLGEEEGL